MLTIDYIIVVVYIIGIMFAGYYLGRSNKTSEDYFVAGRTLPWYAVGLSVGLTMISAMTFIGGPGWGYYDGIVAAMVNYSVPLAMLVATYVIVPVLYHLKVKTTYQYIVLRLGHKTKVLGLITWTIENVILIGGFVYTPALILAEITTISYNIWVPLIVIFAIVYTAIGGIKAVVWTDAIQAIILFLGICLSYMTVIKLMPVSATELFSIAKETGKLTSIDFSPQMDTLTIYCAGVGGFFMWLGYFAFDQAQVQRFLSSKNISNVKKSGVLSSVAMQLLYFSAFFLGVLFFVFYQTMPSTLDFENSNNIMIDFLINYVPNGVLGLLLAATFAAAMSSIDSILNSVTTVFITDIYEPYISKKKDTPLSKSIVTSLVFGILIIFFVYFGLNENTKSILEIVGSIAAIFASFTAGTMYICIFMPKVNDNGSFVGGIIAGIAAYFLKQYLDFHWVWLYMVGIIFHTTFAYFASKFFTDVSEEKRQYTVYGLMDKFKGIKTDDGLEMSPMKMDKMGWTMLVVFIIQTILLLLLQYAV